jgi:copper chaperone CopZ
MRHCIILLLGLWGLGLNAQSQPSNSKYKAEQNENVKKMEISIEGMSCQKGCADGIDKALKKVNGIIRSRTLLETGICKVTYDEHKIKIVEIIKIIEERGFKAKVK